MNLESNFPNIQLIHPQALDCSKISEVFVSPGISLKDDVLKVFNVNKVILYRDLELYSRLTKNQKIIAVTAYDRPSAISTQNAKVDVVLVGDSLSNVVLGNKNTTSIGIKEISYHLEAVCKFIDKSLLVADLPFGSSHIGRRCDLFIYIYYIHTVLCGGRLPWFLLCNVSLGSLGPSLCKRTTRRFGVLRWELSSRAYFR